LPKVVKEEKAMDLERYWYEGSPFLYTAFGGFMLGRADSALLFASSILLLGAGGTILLLRRQHSFDQIRRLRFAVAESEDYDTDAVPG
jgi:hypothetical protein